MAKKPVKHFYTGMMGAPTLTGQAGSLLALLKACLVDGFNLITLDSLVVSGGVLTGTKAGHGFVVDQVIQTSANEAALSGEWTVVSVTSNAFVAQAVGINDVVGTGTLTAKAAPAGWSMPFSGVNKGAFKSIDPVSTGFCLRIDDTGNVEARAVGYESMTDVDTGVNPFPTAAQVSGGAIWTKSKSADSTPVPWLILADAVSVYLVRKTYQDITASILIDTFGDLPSERPGDGYPCCISGYKSSLSQFSGQQNLLGCSDFSQNSVGGLWLARSYSQLGGSVPAATGAFYSTQTVSGYETSGLQYPSPVNNGVILSAPVVMENDTGVIRAMSIPGLYYSPQKAPMSDRDKLTGVSALPGRTLMAVKIVTLSKAGRVFFDLTGPWR